MTAAELKAYIAAQLVAPVNQVAKVINSFNATVDFITNEVVESIPPWTSALTFQTDGTGAGRYCTHPDTTGKKRIFETKVDNNTNHEPPTNPSITEDSFWEEVSSSAGSGIFEWTAGVYGTGLIIVYHTHSVNGPGLYKLEEPVRPFTSSNIETEITAGKWVLLGGVQYFQGYYTSLANLQAAKPTGKPGDYALVDAGVSNDAQLYAWDDNDNDWVLSSGGVVPDATSSVKGIAKLYPSTSLGSNTDGAPDQNAVKAYVDAGLASNLTDLGNISESSDVFTFNCNGIKQAVARYTDTANHTINLTNVTNLLVLHIHALLSNSSLVIGFTLAGSPANFICPGSELPNGVTWSAANDQLTFADAGSTTHWEISITKTTFSATDYYKIKVSGPAT